MKKEILFALLIVLASSMHAQTLTLTDSDGAPVPDVYVYDPSSMVGIVSAVDGTVDLSQFSKSTSIILQHPAFHTQQIAPDTIATPCQITLISQVLEIGAFTVTANRWAQDSRDVSQQVSVINAASIRTSQPGTSADLLQSSGQVFVQKSQLGGGSPMLRGFAANSILLVIDGVRMNNAIYRSGNLQNVINIDPNSLQSAQVIYGPGSVMFGSDALGGVLDFQTLSPRFSTSDSLVSHVNALGRYSSASQEKTGHVDISLGKKKVAYLGSFSYSSFDDLRAGSKRSPGYKGHFKRPAYAGRIEGKDILISNDAPNVQRFSGFNLWNMMHKIHARLSKTWTAQYGYYLSNTSDVPRYDRLAETVGNTDSLVHAEWYYGPQRWQMHRISLSHINRTKAYDQARLTLAWQDYSESRNDRGFGAPRLRTRSESVNLYTLSIDLDKELDHSNVYYGIDLAHNQVNSDGYRRNIIDNTISPTSPRYPDQGSTYSSFSSYANMIKRTMKATTISMGARYSLVHLTATTSDLQAASFGLSDLSLTNHAANGLLGINHQLTGPLLLKALVSTGFRSPNIDDIGKIFEIDDQVIVVPNGDLKPEYSYNQEIALEYHHNQLTWEMTAYHSLLKDAIVRGSYTINGKPNVVLDGEERTIKAQVNADKARIYGLYGKLNWALHEYLKMSASCTYTEGFILGSKEPLRHIPPIFGRYALVFKKNKWLSSFFAEYNLSKPASDIPDSEFLDKPQLYTDTGTPGWITFNWSGEAALGEKIMAHLGVENIFDIHYRPYSSGISAPGRNFKLAFTASF